MTVQSNYSCGTCIIPEQASETLPAFNAIARATSLSRLGEQHEVSLPLVRALGMEVRKILVESAPQRTLKPVRSTDIVTALGCRVSRRDRAQIFGRRTADAGRDLRIGYTHLARAEDTAPQGCDLSADELCASSPAIW